MSPPPLDFEALVARHQGAVCAIAYAVLRDRSRAEEIAQEAFLVAWQKLPGMRPAPALPGWVCGIARNLARNAARRRTEIAMPTETLAEMPTAQSLTLLDGLLAREQSELAAAALATLGEAEREAVVLYYRGDESLGEVAAALGISEAAAKKRVLRGRAHLRSALAEVETTLRATRPGPAFTAGCVAALALGAGVHSASAAGAAHATRPLAGKLALGAGVAGVLVIGGLALRRGPEAPAAAVAQGEAAAASVASAPAVPLVRRLAPAARDQLAAQIDEARARRLAVRVRATPSAAAPAPALAGSAAAEVRTFDFAGSSLFAPLPVDEPRPAGPFERERMLPRSAAEGRRGAIGKRELRAAIRSVQPFVRECYEQSGAHARGTLQLVVRLDGEPDVGTLATDARLEGDFAGNAELAECVRESLLAIALPGLDVGGPVDVYYPFTIE